MSAITSKAAFIHAPKTGGQWIVNVLKDIGLFDQKVGNGHDNKMCIQYSLPRTFKYFTFIRHPLTWLKSLWGHWKDDPGCKLRNIGHYRAKKLWSYVTHGLQMSEFIQKDLNESLEVMMEKYPSFITWFFDKYIDGCDYIGKQENIRTDLIDVLIKTEHELREDQKEKIMKYDSYNVHGIKHKDKYDKKLIDKLFKLEKEYIKKYEYDYIPEGLI